MREAVRSGLADGLSTDEIADIVEGISADNGVKIFEDTRAALIANTEVANANSAGALVGYKTARESGVDVKKAWLPDDDPCPECQANADAGAIDLDDEFPSGDTEPTAHPRCLCSLIPIVNENKSKFAKTRRQFVCN